MSKRTGIAELTSFFIPLGLTASLMMFTHSILSAGLSRTINPTISTAAHAVALSLSDMAGGPLCQIRQTAMALVTSRQSFQAVRRVFLTTTAGFIALMFAIAYVPALSRLVLQQLLGVKDELLPATLLSFRVLMFLPIVSGWRYLYHGVITRQRQTRFISAGMFIRVGLMVTLAFSFSHWHWVQGPLVGSLTLLCGITLEFTMAYVFGHGLVPDGEGGSGDREVWKFYLPLIASSLLVSIGKPFINAGLARMENAAISLAAFSVASSVAWVIISPSQTIHMLTMVFGRELPERALVRKFAASFAGISSALLAVVSFSPAGTWVLTRLISVPPENLAATLFSCRTLAVFPLIICWQEYNMGLLLLNRSTRLVSLGKGLNLSSTILFVLLVAPHLSGPVAAPLAQLIGFVTEGAFLTASRRLASRRVLTEAAA